MPKARHMTQKQLIKACLDAVECECRKLRNSDDACGDAALTAMFSYSFTTGHLRFALCLRKVATWTKDECDRYIAGIVTDYKKVYEFYKTSM